MGAFNQDLHEKLTESFRYEECYRKLCGKGELEPPNSNYRDLLLGLIGHIRLRGANGGSTPIEHVLERYVDDIRRNQNVKYIIPEQHNNVPTPKVENPPVPLLDSL